MDSASRFRKQTLEADVPAVLSSYSSWLLETESDRSSVRSSVDSETVSSASVDCSGDSDSKLSIVSRTWDRSALSERRHRRWQMRRQLRSMHCHRQCAGDAAKRDGHFDFRGCLDSICRLQRCRGKFADHRLHCRGDRHLIKTFIPRPKTQEADLPLSCSRTFAQGTWAIGLATLALSRVAAAFQHVRLQLHGISSQVGKALAGPPRRLVADPAVRTHGLGVLLWNALFRNEGRQEVCLLLLCVLSCIVGVVCACASLILLLLCFTVRPEPFANVPVATAVARADLEIGLAKCLVRILTVILISLSAGQGLALYHPIRDALLCSF